MLWVTVKEKRVQVLRIITVNITNGIAYDLEAVRDDRTKLCVMAGAGFRGSLT